MSSNIRVQRICQHCGTEFTARTTVTKYCGDVCAKKAYKARQRAKKVEHSNNETASIKIRSIEELKAKEFLTVTEASKLINCSRQNVYKLIRSGKLKATNLLEKKTIIRRTDLEGLFTETDTIPAQQKKDLQAWKQAGQFEITNCYTLEEVLKKFNISEAGLQLLIKDNQIPQLQKGWDSYLPKPIIDKLLT